MLEAGYTEMKFFPAEASGGAAFLKSIAVAGAGRPVLPDRRDHRGHARRRTSPCRTSAASAARGSPRPTRSPPATGAGSPSWPARPPPSAEAAGAGGDARAWGGGDGPTGRLRCGEKSARKRVSVHKHQLLQGLHEQLRPRTYFEIGVRKGKSLALSRTPASASTRSTWWTVSCTATCTSCGRRATSSSPAGSRSRTSVSRSSTSPSSTACTCRSSRCATSSTPSATATRRA